MFPHLRFVTFVTIIGATLLSGFGDVPAVEPGVDIAAPRVAIVTANGATLRFVPALAVVEQGDYVRWNTTTGAHTTTSGSPCVANGLWTSPLDATTTSFTRPFNEAPAAFPFFCSPHCGLGMRGQVNVTNLISVLATNVAGSTQLDWSGGSGSYQVFRSDTPRFAAGTVLLTPAGGTTVTSFLDTTGGTPAVDKAFFYLVMNQF